MEILENNKTVLVKGNVIGFERSTLEPSKYLVQFPDLTTASLSVDMIEDELKNQSYRRLFSPEKILKMLGLVGCLIVQVLKCRRWNNWLN